MACRQREYFSPSWGSFSFSSFIERFVVLMALIAHFVWLLIVWRRGESECRQQLPTHGIPPLFLFGPTEGKE